MNIVVVLFLFEFTVRFDKDFTYVSFILSHQKFETSLIPDHIPVWFVFQRLVNHRIHLSRMADDGFRAANVKNPANQKASAYWLWLKKVSSSFGIPNF